MIPLAILMVLGGMVWRDLQSLTSWKEAQATILDRREIVQGGETEYHKDGRRTQTVYQSLSTRAGNEVLSSEP